MSVTDELLSNAEAYRSTFDKGELPLPPARKWPSSPAWTPA
jgi:carbonic anhydrase